MHRAAALNMLCGLVARQVCSDSPAVDRVSWTMQGCIEDQLVSEEMQEKTPTQQQSDHLDERPIPASPHKGLAAGCCLFALLITCIHAGRATEPRLPVTANLASVTSAPPSPALLAQVTTPLETPADVTVGTSQPPSQPPLGTAATGPHLGWVEALPAPMLVQATPAADMTMDIFLDRLMRAESGGRLTAKSSTSTALGPFQFIDGTFFSVVHRHFSAETATFTPTQVLALRTDLAFARRAAEAFTNDNAALLVGAGIPATFQNLQLAYLLGPGGAIKVLQTDPEMPLARLMPANVLRANAFMRPLTVSGLVARAARDVAVTPASRTGIIAKPAPPAEVAAAVAITSAAVANPAGTRMAALPVRLAAPTIVMNCDLGLPSCRRWLALEQRRQGRNRTVREARVR